MARDRIAAFGFYPELTSGGREVAIHRRRFTTDGAGLRRSIVSDGLALVGNRSSGVIVYGWDDLARWAADYTDDPPGGASNHGVIVGQANTGGVDGGDNWLLTHPPLSAGSYYAAFEFTGADGKATVHLAWEVDRGSTMYSTARPKIVGDAGTLATGSAVRLLFTDEAIYQAGAAFADLIGTAPPDLPAWVEVREVGIVNYANVTTGDDARVRGVTVRTDYQERIRRADTLTLDGIEYVIVGSEELGRYRELEFRGEAIY